MGSYDEILDQVPVERRGRPQGVGGGEGGRAPPRAPPPPHCSAGCTPTPPTRRQPIR